MASRKAEGNMTVEDFLRQEHKEMSLEVLANTDKLIQEFHDAASKSKEQLRRKVD